MMITLHPNICDILILDQLIRILISYTVVEWNKNGCYSFLYWQWILDQFNCF